MTTQTQAHESTALLALADRCERTLSDRFMFKVTDRENVVQCVTGNPEMLETIVAVMSLGGDAIADMLRARAAIAAIAEGR